MFPKMLPGSLHICANHSQYRVGGKIVNGYYGGYYGTVHTVPRQGSHMALRKANSVYAYCDLYNRTYDPKSYMHG